jgi:uncharacterized protein YdeI (YjbR/CyaY-like superfamily)
MKPRFFATQNEFRNWLEKNHETAKELLVGFWKVASGKPSMNWSESVDQALCFGWIDGVRRRLDDQSYTIRFTARRPTSVWSKINIDKVAVLTQKGLMRPAGLAAFEKRREDRSEIYAYENSPREFTGAMKERFQKENSAWDFFEAQAPSYRRLMVYWVTSAKQDATREKRLGKLIAASRERKRL